jgi:hypothetical protein
MARFNISLVAVNRHHTMYDDVVQSMAESLKALGHACSIVMNTFEADAINILVGSSIFASRHLHLLERLRGKFYVVYQLEQLDEAHGLLNAWPEYNTLLTKAGWIWDYAPSSTAFLRARGFANVAYLPPGFHACLDKFRPVADPKHDIVFLGTQHPRRDRILDALRGAGCSVDQMYGVYGAERNARLADARIALNIHAWDRLNILETIRLGLLLANRGFVISETSDHNPYGEGVVYADYDALVETCLDYLKRPVDNRAAIAAKGAAIFREQDMVALMRAVLAETLNIT